MALILYLKRYHKTYIKKFKLFIVNTHEINNSEIENSHRKGYRGKR